QVFPFARVPQRRQVVDQSIDPDVDDLILVPWDRHAPGLARSRETEVLQTALDEAARLVVAEVRPNEVRPLVVQTEQGLLERRQAEEPIPFLDPLGHDPVDRALPVDQLVHVLELLAADAVETGVDVLVDVTVVEDPLDKVLDEALVAVIARANEEVR